MKSSGVEASPIVNSKKVEASPTRNSDKASVVTEPRRIDALTFDLSGSSMLSPSF